MLRPSVVCRSFVCLWRYVIVQNGVSYGKSYYWQPIGSRIWTRNQAVARIADRTVLPHSVTSSVWSVTWPFDTHMPFLIGSPLERSLYLEPFYGFQDIPVIVLGSRVRPSRVTLCHRSRDHLIPHMPFPIGGLFGTKPLFLTVSEILNVKCNAMVDMTLIRPLNNGQDHSFWYQSISHIRLPMLSIVTFALGRTV